MKQGYWDWWIKKHGELAILLIILAVVITTCAGMYKLVFFIISLNLSDIQLSVIVVGPIAMIIAFIIMDSYHTYKKETK